MRRASFYLPAVLIVYAGVSVPSVSASERAVATIAASAQFNTRTSLIVSTETLHFDVTNARTPPSVSVEFVAAARTRADGELVLTVEPARAIEGPGGAADVEASVDFAGDGEGTLAGLIDPMIPAVAARWTGSGRHTGRLRFSLRTSTLGAYTLPVRFVLSAP